jgi:hypothetical protein
MNPEFILGNSYGVFLGVTLFWMCGCAVVIGASIARKWLPARHVLPFGLALGVLDRAIAHTLFQSDLFSPGGLLIDTYCILLAGLLAWRYTLAIQLVRQYPWMYRRSLILGWRRLRQPV